MKNRTAKAGEALRVRSVVAERGEVVLAVEVLAHLPDEVHRLVVELGLEHGLLGVVLGVGFPPALGLTTLLEVIVGTVVVLVVEVLLILVRVPVNRVVLVVVLQVVTGEQATVLAIDLVLEVGKLGVEPSARIGTGDPVATGELLELVVPGDPAVLDRGEAEMIGSHDVARRVLLAESDDVVALPDDPGGALLALFGEAVPLDLEHADRPGRNGHGGLLAGYHTAKMQREYHISIAKNRPFVKEKSHIYG